MKFDHLLLLIENAGGEIRVGNLVYYPPRVGPTLWEIGVPDRTAAEFFVPDPDSKRVNNLYTNHADKYKAFSFSFFSIRFEMSIRMT